MSLKNYHRMKSFEKKKLKYQSKDTPDLAFRQIKNRANEYFADDSLQKEAKKLLLVKSAILFLSLFAAYYLLLNAHYVPALFVYYILFGGIFLIIGINLGHDAAHHCVTGNKKIDNFLFQTIFKGPFGYWFLFGSDSRDDCCVYWRCACITKPHRLLKVLGGG